MQGSLNFFNAIVKDVVVSNLEFTMINGSTSILEIKKNMENNSPKEIECLKLGAEEKDLLENFIVNYALGRFVIETNDITDEEIKTGELSTSKIKPFECMVRIKVENNILSAEVLDEGEKKKEE